MVTGDSPTAMSNAAKDCKPSVSDFALNLGRRFPAVRSREDLATVYGRLEGEGMGEVRHLVYPRVLSRPTSAFLAACSLDCIEDLALSTVRDQAAVLAAELEIAVDDHDIVLEGPLPMLSLPLSLPSAPCVTAAE